MFPLDKDECHNEYLPLISLQGCNAFQLISHLLLLQSNVLFTYLHTQQMSSVMTCSFLLNLCLQDMSNCIFKHRLSCTFLY